MEKNKVNYVGLFDGLVREIEAIDILELVEYTKIEGVSLDEINDFENENYALDPSLKDFYLQTNGVGLRWKIKEGIDMKFLRELTDGHSDYYYFIDEEDAENPFANINILPFEEVFYKSPLLIEDTDEQMDFNGKKFSVQDFSKKLKILDKYSDFAGLVFIYGVDLEENNLIMATNHYDNWKGSKLINFKNYIQLIVATKGICEARENYLKMDYSENISIVELISDISQPLLFENYFRNK